MYNRVSTFLEIVKILHENQYGFRKKSSTYLALLSFVDKVIQAIEKGEYAVGVFLDFSKAFDTVDHDILLDKLDHYGIRGCALSWFKTYLSCRTQYVTYDGSESNRQMIKCGVPQGSILGPLLFLIYINDLCTVCKNTIPVLFADDTNLFSSGINATGIQDGVNHDLAIITKWLKANKLSLNIKKTYYMCFQQKNKVKPDISLKIDGEIIAEVTTSKFLGVIIDDKLNWKDHVSFVCRKVARGLGAIIKARKVLRNESLKNLYYLYYLEKVVYDILVLYFGIQFSVQISIQMLVILYSLEIQRQRSVIIYFSRNYTKLYVAYYWQDYCVITVAPLHPLHPCWDKWG